jgi:hypothetical protein
MILNNTAPVIVNNTSFKKAPALPGEGNKAWLKRIIGENDFDPRGLLLLGGASVADFHIRVAQSSLRFDLTPSHWSQVGVLPNATSFYSIPFQWKGELSDLPHFNAIQLCKMSDYDDPDLFPNIAFVQFTRDMDMILENAERLKMQRSVIDLPELVIRWLEYVWAVGQAGNPLANGKGLPSAVFAETIFGIGGIELTPGLATASSCPEAIWQAAKWWKAYYDESSKISVASQARPMAPAGCFFMRQESAMVYKPYVPPTDKKKTPAKAKLKG